MSVGVNAAPAPALHLPVPCPPPHPTPKYCTKPSTHFSSYHPLMSTPQPHHHLKPLLPEVVCQLAELAFQASSYTASTSITMSELVTEPPRVPLTVSYKRQ